MNERSDSFRRALIAALVLVATPLLAQTERTNDEERSIENIIVTAQKREQSLQDVPIVVTAVSEQLLRDTGVRDIKDLTLLTPGLIVTSSSNESSTTARIRGIGTVGDNPGLESSVGVVIDGVYRPRNGVGFGDLGELERIEVLKGPQGTLFGKNTSAGVINVLSKRPSFDFGSEAEVTAGNYGTREASVSLTGPIADDKLAGRIYVASRERDGYLDIERGPGPRQQDEDSNRDFYTGRGQLLFKPNAALDVRLVIDYSKRDEDCCAAPQVMLTPEEAILDSLSAIQPGSFADPANPFARRAYSNRPTPQKIEDKGASVEVNWKLDALGGATLTSVTAWRDWSIVAGQDSDFTTADILYRKTNGENGNDFKQRSQELRLAGESDRLSWLVGAFYAHEDLESRNEVAFGNQYRDYFSTLLGDPPFFALLPEGIAFPGELGQRDVYEQDSSSWALFTNNSIRLTDALELTLGLRYTNESKDLDTQFFNEDGGVGCQTLRDIPGLAASPYAPFIFGIGCATYADPIYNDATTRQSLDEHEWSGTAKLAYRFTEQVMAYASYARGYKASGYNLDRERLGDASLSTSAAIDADAHFNKELVDSYELGTKTQWFDNSLSLNASVFRQVFTDFQLNTFSGISYIVTSVPEVTSKGVDVDFVWYTPLEQLSLQGGVTYADTKYGDFTVDPTSGVSTRLPGARVSFAPEWSGSLSVTFEQPFANKLLWRTNVGGKYNSEYNTGSDLAPQKKQPGFAVLNARTGIGAEDEGWTVEAWAQNLTDKQYYQVIFDATLQTGTYTGFLGAPRTFGVTARFKF